jgi:hypothetical protein
MLPSSYYCYMEKFNFRALPSDIPPPARRSQGVYGPLGFEKQRGGAKDCVVATTSTLTGVDYLEIAEMLGVSIDPATGIAVVPNGVDGMRTLNTFYRLGWSATLLVGRAHKSVTEDENGPYFLTQEELLDAIKGRRALISYTDDDPAVGEHMLAWDGRVALDCSNGEVMDLAEVIIEAVIVIDALRPRS